MKDCGCVDCLRISDLHLEGLQKCFGRRSQFERLCLEKDDRCSGRFSAALLRSPVRHLNSSPPSGGRTGGGPVAGKTASGPARSREVRRDVRLEVFPAQRAGKASRLQREELSCLSALLPPCFSPHPRRPAPSDLIEGLGTRPRLGA
ncbi:hypothetical protein GHT09_004827 [Marmota monax]|uniref:Uncharacterized protein n=1 Tax=Marmota monax TaxID=9995 RepID=A0A834V4Z5_MARMO|nr:hypothetical protein GHT09_004827 [Marmota monax]